MNKIMAGLFALILMLGSVNAHALLISQFVDDPFTTYSGSNPYDSASTSMFLDPAETLWVAWNSFPDVRITDPNYGDQHFLGNGGFGTDDYFNLTVTNPTGQSLTYRMDYNNFSGISSGQQNVIFGDASDAPDAYRSFSYVQIFDEGGIYDSIFNVAGDYTFSFIFLDHQQGGSAAHDAIWLLAEFNDPPPPVIPEPATACLVALGLFGILKRRYS